MLRIYQLSSLVFVIVGICGCQHRAVPQTPTISEMRATSVQNDVQQAQSISAADAAKFSDIRTAFLGKRELTPEEIRFIIRTVKKTQGHSDSDYFTQRALTSLALQRSYPADVHNDVFDFTQSIADDYATKRHRFEMTTLIAKIFVQLKDKRAIPILQAYPRLGGKYYNFQIDCAIAALS